jgi:predicted nucleic acid-binding protein
VATKTDRLVDTNVLVYRFDPRHPGKQQTATELLREGLVRSDLIVPQQALIEFIAATTRPRPDLDDRPLLERDEAIVEVEALIAQFPVIYPTEDTLITAMRGMATYGLSWFDAHLWAFAETHGIPELLSEDFQHGRRYGHVRITNPFALAEGTVQELPPLYA